MIAACIWVGGRTEDGRFDELKPYFVAFFGTWNIQGTWCFLTALSVFAYVFSNLWLMFGKF